MAFDGLIDGPRLLMPIDLTKLTELGRYRIGSNLYLRNRSATDRCFVFRFSRAGNRRDMILGALRDMTLEQAEAATAECRNQLARGLDPIEERKRARTAVRRDTATRLADLEQSVERLSRELNALAREMRSILSTSLPDRTDQPDIAASNTSEIPRISTLLRETGSDQSRVHNYIAATLARGVRPTKTECAKETGLTYPRIFANWPKDLPDARGRPRTKVHPTVNAANISGGKT